MELETLTLNDVNTIPSYPSNDGIRIRQSGMAKVLWRKLDVDVPESAVIPNGIDIYKE